MGRAVEACIEWEEEYFSGGRVVSAAWVVFCARVKDELGDELVGGVP